MSINTATVCLSNNTAANCIPNSTKRFKSDKTESKVSYKTRSYFGWKSKQS